MKEIWTAKEVILTGGSRDLLGASSVLAKTLLVRELSEQQAPTLIGSPRPKWFLAINFHAHQPEFMLFSRRFLHD